MKYEHKSCMAFTIINKTTQQTITRPQTWHMTTLGHIIKHARIVMHPLLTLSQITPSKSHPKIHTFNQELLLVHEDY